MIFHIFLNFLFFITIVIFYSLFFIFPYHLQLLINLYTWLQLLEGKKPKKRKSLGKWYIFKEVLGEIKYD
jgi:hypothetical protein